MSQPGLQIRARQGLFMRKSEKRDKHAYGKGLFHRSFSLLLLGRWLHSMICERTGTEYTMMNIS